VITVEGYVEAVTAFAEEVANEVRRLPFAQAFPAPSPTPAQEILAVREGTGAVELGDASAANEAPLLFLSWGGAAAKAVAAALAPILEDKLPGVSVFFSSVSIEPVDDPQDRLFEQGLLVAHALVAVLTREGAGRPYVIWETAAVWGRGKLVVPMFVDIEAGKVPGPLTTKAQGIRLGDKADVVRAVAKLQAHFSVPAQSELSNDQWASLEKAVLAAKAGSVVATPTLPAIPAEFLQRTMPLHDGLHEGTLLAIEVRTRAEIEEATITMTAITGPLEAVVMPAPARLFWHPGHEVAYTIAQGAAAHIQVARIGPDIPGALLDSPDHDLPWSLSEGSYRVELQLTARGFAVQMFVAEFAVSRAEGLGLHIEWTGFQVLSSPIDAPREAPEPLMLDM